jgi:RNA polymerase sigma factor (sigma-70 family)
MSAIRATIKVRNNLLLTAIEKSGHAPGQKFAEKVGITYADLHGLISMKNTAIDKHGDIRPSVLKLMEFLGKMLHELFTDTQAYRSLEKNTSDVEIDEAQVMALMSHPLSMDDKELQVAVDGAIGSIGERESRILRLRFGIDCSEHTLAEVGVMEGISKDRVRQIQERALRKLRHPSRIAALRVFA